MSPGSSLTGNVQGCPTLRVRSSAMYPPPPQHDLPPVPHLLPARQFWELELCDQLQCMPEALSTHVAEACYWWIRGTKKEWQWWAWRIPALARYLDGLLDMLEEFRPQGASAELQGFQVDFAALYLADSWVRLELTAATMCWPMCHIHLPCWEVVLHQATSPEVGG